jgi:hypothetical protein
MSWVIVIWIKIRTITNCLPWRNLNRRCNQPRRVCQLQQHRSRNFVFFLIIKQLPRSTCNNCVCCAGSRAQIQHTCGTHWGRDTLEADRATRALAVGPQDKDLMWPTVRVRASATVRQVGPTLVVSPFLSVVGPAPTQLQGCFWNFSLFFFCLYCACGAYGLVDHWIGESNGYDVVRDVELWERSGSVMWVGERRI